MAGRIDNQTSEVIESHGIDNALHFHLSCRVFPARPDMVPVARAAIEAYNAGEEHEAIDLAGICQYQGEDTAPALAIVEHLNLWAFVQQDDEF